MEIILTVIILLTVILGGGYFVAVSSAVSVILLLTLCATIIKNKTIKIPYGINILTCLIITAGYLFSCLWAVDRGMALTGWVKFLPVTLFAVTLSLAAEYNKRIIDRLPLIGAVMTVLSFIMMNISMFKPYVSVAGRLSGFFQYPNTYALFMLICMVIVCFRLKDTKEKVPIDVIYLIITFSGIYLSGSRAVLGLTCIFVLYFIIHIFKNNKKAVFIIAVILVLSGTAVYFFNRESITHIISSNMSTFWGRCLYYKDALPYIMHHPFGIGYYGYAFVQSEFQTGIYNVVNIHNELLQTMLDIGWFPALMLYFCIVKSIISKNVCIRDKAVLIIICLHSLFDFDFQFISMFFIMMLFLENDDVKEIHISNMFKTAAAAISLMTVIISVITGVSDGMCVFNKYEKAFEIYPGNTYAKINQLYIENDEQKKEKLAYDIIEHNKHVSYAYSCIARAELSKGSIERYIDYKDRAIELDPYNITEYEEYMDVLEYCFEKYMEKGSYESAMTVADKILSIPELLKEVEDKTSWLGWRIKDVPDLKLQNRHMIIIDKIEKMIQY